MATGEELAGGTVHALPDDLEQALRNAPATAATWAAITPLARNEWICWVTSPKKPETRVKRVAWGMESLGEGKRRPCCWPGCPHRERGKG
ncbi:YdeI/OmpD-associated family protein [Sphingomonas swuensis]|uniref:YdeI/OmpD-associated family protein n=1 Tax=Sphingomonas swuensis TaxID=977800 RepID=A0ABP7T7W9_9SPHN